jgi:hypothetical protein
MYRISGKNIEIDARPSPRRGIAKMGAVQVFPGMVIDVFPQRPLGRRTADRTRCTGG